MSHNSSITPPSRRDPLVRGIVESWRRLTGGSTVRDPERRTLLACSGGCDSSALVLALSTVNPKPIVAHIVHDLRPQAEALGDLDLTQQLAERLGLEFVSERIQIAELAGNAEANARAARYDALARLAEAQDMPFVATAHHGDDQAETILMRLVRGAGPRGLSGIHERRAMAGGVTLVRPMLEVSRQAAESLCRASGWAWATDRTNADVSRLRASIRAKVMPGLRESAPGAVVAIARAARLQGEIDQELRDRANAVIDLGEATEDGWCWPLDVVDCCSPVVLAYAIREALHRCSGGSGMDLLSERVLKNFSLALQTGIPNTADPCGPFRAERTLAKAILRVGK